MDLLTMKLPVKPPPLKSLMAVEKDDEEQSSMARLIELLLTDVGKDRNNEYLHWDKMRYKPLPEDVNSHEEWWLVTKLRRSSAYRKLPFKSVDGRDFVYWLPDSLQQRLHQVDQQASGRVQIAAEVANPRTRDRYLVNSLIEEAITSSQLEGASTTHKVAKAMLREGRRPQDTSERMIFNNYQAMIFIRDVVNEALTKELLLELHRIVTGGTLDDPTAVGRLRTPDEELTVFDVRDNTLLHEPPDASELEQRIQLLCDFANSKSSKGEFLHPIIQSIILHYTIGYDHPFVDGNGRTARALFYWSMARHGYWMMEYVSISTIIKNGPSKYARAYLYAECDDNDATYFIDFNLRLIIRAIKKLQVYLASKVNEIKDVEQILGSSLFAKRLNHRQVALISHALRNPGEIYSIESHRKSHSVTYPTARTDLLQLAEYGLLEQRKIGNAYAFRAINNVQDRLEELKTQSVD